MTGEAEVLPALTVLPTDTGIKIGDVVGPGLAEVHALAPEAERPKRAFEELQRAPFGRSHAFAAHQGARQFDDVGDGRSQGVGHRRTLQLRLHKEKSAGPRSRPTLS